MAGSTFAKTSDPANGSVVFNANGTFTYTPNANFTGTDTFTYEVCTAVTGPARRCEVAQVTITVAAPTPAPVPAPVPVNSPLGLLAGLVGLVARRARRA